MQTRLSSLALAGILACGVTTVSADVKLVASPEPGWPQWRGPARDGTSTETGLLPVWPQGGPALLWKAEGIGNGYCSPVVSRGGIYITGDEGEKLSIFAYGVDGRRKWKVTNGRSWKKPWPGSRSCCSYDNGRLYHMNAHGRLVCLDADDGRELWSVVTLEQYGAKNIIWGISEAPLVIGNMVIVTPAGTEALMVALDKTSGREIWRTAPLQDDQRPSYASSIVLETPAGRQAVNCNASHVFGVRLKDGELLWKHRHQIPKQMVAVTPAFCSGAIIVPNSSRYSSSTFALKLAPHGNAVEMKWALELCNPLGSAICRDGRVLFNSSHKPNGWFLVDAKTGEIKDKREDVKYGSGVYANGRFYCLSGSGKMRLLDAAVDKLKTVSEFDFVPNKKDAWAHPVICDRRLYLRYGDALSCYDIKAD